MMNSIWGSYSGIPRFPSLEQDTKTDVLIVGGGLAGILCAYKLARQNVDYLLIESDRICSGVTRNTTAKITSQHGLIYDKLIREFDVDTARIYYQANEDALKQFRELAKTVDCDLETKDNYIYSADSPNELEKELKALGKIGASAGLVKELPLPFQTVGAVRFKNQAQFHPLKFAYEISKGLNICENTRAFEFSGNIVVTNRGKITANRIIMATHFPVINRHGGYFLKMYQSRSYVLALADAQDMNGMYLDAEENGLSFRNYGNMLLLGGGGHRTGKQGGCWKVLSDLAKKHYPNAHEKYRWATQDCMTLDGMPYIGQYGRSTPNLYVATGFNKWGMTSSMVAATILSDLVQGRDNIYSEAFSPSRTVLRKQLFVNAFEATVNLLTPTSPRCPHLGCALKWNPEEHSWDCPCHGSRFTKEGKLLDNPATGDLKQDK